MIPEPIARSPPRPSGSPAILIVPLSRPLARSRPIPFGVKKGAPGRRVPNRPPVSGDDPAVKLIARVTWSNAPGSRRLMPDRLRSPGQQPGQMSTQPIWMKELRQALAKMGQDDRLKLLERRRAT